MEKDLNKTENNADENTDLNANSAYSGSGNWQPGGNNGEPDKLENYTESALNDDNDTTDTVNENINKASNTSKLSDLKGF
ncbi:hypothetical protein [Flavobacterium sp.]|uniref:hypothetical protein n=1 Tax=Flavobacterium sp. TaxID=239 RepID=UPI002B92EB8F|nr:hypothetical protein [Flavobacterium sp.]HSD06230.1 hypothetical protein [Flavobacterium sp.]